VITASSRVLENGLTVVVVRRPYVHTVAMGAFVRVGTRHETTEEIGLAHFLEHLLFRGSSRHADSIDLSREVEGYGGTFDAFVHQEMTAYLMDIHQAHWKRGLDLLGDVLLDPAFDATHIELEKRIVSEEMGYHTDSRGDLVYPQELVCDLLWGRHVAQSDPHQSRRNLEHFDRDAVLEFHRTHYTADKIVVVLVGDLPAEEALKRATERFRSVPPGTGKARELVPVTTSGGGVTVRMVETSQVDASIGLHAYPYGHADYPAAGVMTEIVGGGTASRLFGEVRERRGLVYDIRATYTAFNDVGALLVSTTCGDSNLEPTLASVLDVLDEIYVAGVTDEEISRAITLSRADADYLLDRPGELCEWFGRTMTLDRLTDPPDPREEIERVAAVTGADVARVIADVLRPENRALAVVGPIHPRQKRPIGKIFRARTGGAG
jgi:predicted Zn-dependent peptidase